MKLSLVSLTVMLASTSAFTSSKPTFSRSVVRVGATPSAEDLEKTRKVIQDFFDKKEGKAVEPEEKKDSKKKEAAAATTEE